MKPYLDLLKKVRHEGISRPDRTGVGTYSLFGERLEIQLSSAPVLTTKHMNLKPLLTELAWFLKGDTTTDYLHEHDVKLWDPWADEEGSVGPIYGKQWRKWGIHQLDQLSEVVTEIELNPFSRRLVVSAWNVEDLPAMALPPCPVMFQFYVDDFAGLSCHVYQRSADIFLGLPFDLAQYGILTQLIAQQTGLYPGRLIFSFGDLHLYKNHLAQADQQLKRTPLERPGIKFKPGTTIDNFEPDSVKITNYNFHPAIHGKVAI